MTGHAGEEVGGDRESRSARSHILEITASRLATAIFAGEYASAFRGRGIDFDQVREYQPGDDVRSIEWNVTARMGRPFIKDFIEERELTVILVIDRSPSMDFGTARCTKLEAASEACALLAFAALRSHDRTALLSIGDGRLRYLAPGKGKRHTAHLVREADEPQLPGGRGGSLGEALEQLGLLLKGRGVICVFSDFIDPVPSRPLAALAARHDVVAMAVSDPAERVLPDAGVLRVRDPETGCLVCLDSSDPQTRRRFSELMERRRTGRKLELLWAGADYVELRTELSPVEALSTYFRNRRHRRLMRGRSRCRH